MPRVQNWEAQVMQGVFIGSVAAFIVVVGFLSGYFSVKLVGWCRRRRGEEVEE
jgi:hypothetical protein